LTRLIFERHLKHNKNVVPPEELEKGRSLGRWMAEHGIKIDAAHSSPAGRCLLTILAVLEGAGKMVDVITEALLVPFANEPGIDVDALKAKAKEMGVEAEEAIFDPSLGLQTILNRRKVETAKCLRDIAAQHPGQTVLVCSHGGSRMEIGLDGLLHPDTPATKPDRFVERGSFVEVIFEDNGEIRINWDH